MEAVSSCNVLAASYLDGVLYVTCLDHRQWGVPLASRAESLGVLHGEKRAQVPSVPGSSNLHVRRDWEQRPPGLGDLKQQQVTADSCLRSLQVAGARCGHAGTWLMGQAPSRAHWSPRWRASESSGVLTWV